MCKKDEWLLQTSYSRANRLAPLGITNVHSAIKGRFVTTDEEAKEIANAIVRMQGHTKGKRAEDRWKDGDLHVHFRPFYLKSILCDFVVTGDRANKRLDVVPFCGKRSSIDNMHIDHIFCPTCDHGMSSHNFTLYREGCFSNLCCKRCKVRCYSRGWLCACNVPWPKCTIHRNGSKLRKITTSSKVMRG